MVNFTATPQTDKIVVAWETGTELNTAGFHVLRSTTGKREDAKRVTTELIAAQGDGARGATYRWEDTASGNIAAYTYWLEEVEIDGDINEHGPVKVSLPIKTPPLTPQMFVPLATK